MAYTPPLLSIDVRLASVGYSPTPLSTPVVLGVRFTVSPTPVATQFGTPLAARWLIQDATSDAPQTLFGAPTHNRGQFAEGFANTTYYGAPYLLPHAVGFSTTVVPEQHALYNHIQTATGAPPSTILSAHSTPLPVTGIYSTVFGTVLGLQHWNVEGFSSTRITQYAYYAFTQTTPTAGATTTRFGTALGLKGTPSTTNAFCMPTGVKVTQFGTATTAAPIMVTATGIEHTQTFGTLTSSRGQAASSIAPATQFGTATAVSVATASLGKATQFGTPASHRNHPVASLYHATRFGKPRATKTKDYVAYPFARRTIFGRPTYIRSYPTTTGACSTLLGTPYCTITYPALHIPPTTYFGKPLMTRTPLC